VRGQRSAEGQDRMVVSWNVDCGAHIDECRSGDCRFGLVRRTSPPLPLGASTTHMPPRSLERAPEGRCSTGSTPFLHRCRWWACRCGWGRWWCGGTGRRCGRGRCRSSASAVTSSSRPSTTPPIGTGLRRWQSAAVCVQHTVSGCNGMWGRAPVLSPVLVCGNQSMSVQG
jgi:hypothetical protein